MSKAVGKALAHAQLCVAGEAVSARWQVAFGPTISMDAHLPVADSLRGRLLHSSHVEATQRTVLKNEVVEEELEVQRRTTVVAAEHPLAFQSPHEPLPLSI